VLICCRVRNHRRFRQLPFGLRCLKGAGDTAEGSGLFERLRGLIGLGSPGNKEVPGHMKLALPLAAAGIAIMSPGIKDALMSFLNPEAGTAARTFWSGWGSKVITSHGYEAQSTGVAQWLQVLANAHRNNPAPEID
jgi:hypothetical protein